jgi:hypothetical protein
MKRLLLTLVCLSLPSLVHAQTQATQTLAYDYADTAANVAAYVQTVKVDGATVPTAPVCALNGTVTTCTVTIPTLAAGTHTVDITATKSGMAAETIVSGLNPTNGPKSAANIRISVVVTVTVP